MSSFEVYTALAVFAASGVVVLVAACVMAKRADERMREWMAERQRLQDPLERQFSMPAVRPRRHA